MAPDDPAAQHASDEDDAYISAEDEDFRPDDAMSVDSDSDAEPSQAAATKPRPASVGPIARDEVDGLMKDAGHKRGPAADGEDESGAVKTRSMAAADPSRARKPLASGRGATIDVDAAWARLNAAPLAPPPPQHTPQPSPSKPTPAHTPQQQPAMVEVTETYRFAGEVHTRTRLVARGSEAPLDGSRPAPAATRTGAPLLRPLRRVSAFEPNPAGAVRNLPPRPGQAAAQKPAAAKSKNKAARHAYAIPAVRSVKRLNVVDKSMLDWHAHVERTGQRDELEAARKEKGNFLERRDFLERVEDREQETRLAAKAKA